MTKPIEDALNLPRLSDVLAETEPTEPEVTEELEEDNALEKFRKMKAALETLSPESIFENDTNIDEIKREALSSYKDMLDAGFACDSKHASNFLEPAVQALNIALDSEKTRTNRKVDYMRIKLQQEKNDLMRRKIELEEKRLGQHADIIGETTVYMDRNELLRKLLGSEELEVQVDSSSNDED